MGSPNLLAEPLNALCRALDKVKARPPLQGLG